MSASKTWQKRSRDLFSKHMEPLLEKQITESEISKKTAIKGDPTSVIESTEYSHSNYPYARFADIANESETYILNVAVFPKPGLNCPLIEAELVILRGKLFLYLLEINSLEVPVIDQEKHDQFFQEFLNQYPSLKNVDDIPDWAHQIMSSHFVWSRPNTEEAIEEAFESLGKFYELSADTMNQNAKKLSAEETAVQKKNLEQYIDVYLKEVPSRPFLKMMFGDDWTEKYLEEFVFPKKKILV